MKNRFSYTFLTVVMVLTTILSACTSVAATPTATTVPPTVAVPAFQAQSLAAPDCNYGGNIKSIEAPDANTVVFNLCKSDPAFISKVAFPSFSILPKALLDSTGGDSAKISNTPKVGS